MELLTPKYFKDYELIDCGGFEKLERFGKYITIRPEPQAIWDKKLSEKEWGRSAHVKFVAKSSSSGTWQKLREIPDKWNINYNFPGSQDGFKLKLSLTSFKHLGVFPEQAVNWDYIHKSITDLRKLNAAGSKMEGPGGNVPRFLNLFAYTGAASLAAKAAGADVVHVDSIKQVVSWARENMELSGLKDIRWVVEDALKFVKREVKRGNLYNGIILDPPAYGHGPTGEKWKLEDNINEMINEVLQLLDPKQHFLVLNTYSLGFSSIIIENLLANAVKSPEDLKTGELYLKASSGVKLPLGVFGRFRSF